MKLVINNCFGGFSLSSAAEVEYAKLAGFEIFRYQQTKYKHRNKKDLFEKVDANSEDGFITFTFKKDHGDSFSEFPDDDSYWYSRDIERNDPLLIQVIEKLGKKANGGCASLKIVEIPDDIEWEISEYDGNEHVAECHQIWG